jgi:hypothetical protein
MVGVYKIGESHHEVCFFSWGKRISFFEKSALCLQNFFGKNNAKVKQRTVGSASRPITLRHFTRSDVRHTQ